MVFRSDILASDICRDVDGYRVLAEELGQSTSNALCFYMEPLCTGAGT